MQAPDNLKIALALLEKVGPVTAKKLVAFAGGLEKVFSLTKKELLKIPGISNTLALKISEQDVLKDADLHAKWCVNNGVKVISFWDDDYPQRLRHCDDGPVVLFCRGNGDLNPEKTLAIVGTRNITRYGRDFIEQFTEELRPFNVQIISGLAYGVDIEAHRQAIRFGMSTLAVLGNGPDKLYPAAHRATAEEMLPKGAVLTEFLPGTPPDKENFPTRNRIVAGMADATLVIESDVKGGSIITANLAHSYNREVFALPGRVDDKYSAGCNKLIFEQKAAILRSATDMAIYMNWDLNEKKAPVQASLFLDFNPEEQAVMNYLRDKGKCPIDKISLENALTMPRCSSLLLELEFKGAVRSLPGKVFEAC